MNFTFTFTFIFSLPGTHCVEKKQAKRLLEAFTEIFIYRSILMYIQQNATLHSLFYLETALHVSGGTTTYHHERIQLYLQHLAFVTPLLLPAAISDR
jgi:hypothetical protein